jgi:hypothetical protein
MASSSLFRELQVGTPIPVAAGDFLQHVLNESRSGMTQRGKGMKGRYSGTLPAAGPRKLAMFVPEYNADREGFHNSMATRTPGIWALHSILDALGRATGVAAISHI